LATVIGSPQVYWHINYKIATPPLHNHINQNITTYIYIRIH
jgi:hypothetical protein